jgi:tellurite resistance protein TerA
LGSRFGAKDQPPYIHLDKDDRSGAALDGENLRIWRPDLVDLVLVFAMIYEGAAGFTQVGGRLFIRDGDGNEIKMQLNSPETLGFCAVATLNRVGDGLVITKQERYFHDHREADAAFGFGFNWVAGQKD